MESITAASISTRPVVFNTKTSYSLPSQRFMIPATWKRYQLSQLVNKALNLSKPIPFDFVVRGEVLRTTLEEWCAHNGIGGEETLEVEYIESVMPPERVSDIPHDDWVSSVSCTSPGYLLTASYDGQIRAFNHSKQLVASTLAHSGPITSICVIPPSPLGVDGGDGGIVVGSASHDLTARITRLRLSDSPGDVQMDDSFDTQTLASLHLHTAPVSSIAASPTGSHLLTSSWDGLIGVWDTTIPKSNEVDVRVITDGRRKRRKVDSSAENGKTKAPVIVMKSHTARVSQVIFAGAKGEHAVSCGFDSTVRVWDVDTGICAHTVTASEKPFLALSLPPASLHASSDENYTPGAPTTILAASTDRTMTVFDIRTSSSASVGASLSFLHQSTPSCISTNLEAPYQVITGAYDGIVRVWDVRSNKGAMATMRAWTDDEEKTSQIQKVLSVDWKRGIVGVGGEGGFEVWKVTEGKN